MTSAEVIGQPFVSVVIPVYNDAEGIRMTLESVIDQTYSHEAYEILAVDNNSNDGTRTVIEKYCERYPDLVQLAVEDERQGQSAALNKGIQHAHGSLIAFIDADMTVERTWLEDITKAMSEHDVEYLGCNVNIYIPEGEETYTARYNKISGFPMGEYIKSSHFVGSGCLVVTRNLINEVGPFNGNLDFSFDREFGNRVHAAGFDQHFESDIVMSHPARTSLRSLLSKSIRTGRGKTHLKQRYPERFETRSLSDPRNYLPLHPVRFLSRMMGDNDISMDELIVLYLIGCLSKLVRNLSAVYEQFQSNSSKNG
ncbi:glycosyltransferase [Halococcus dombrowskii]|uniref:Glycosyltransferase n=1 Tax=Halococcus dombrowskii TaxID=179637 RepID=A0AAX3APY8_HALDO|nr:glycosyltransferase [Halococcus dombrowskii]UOO94992.1 glycosyltransferase [Halococcus dombrowskii]